MFASEWRGKGLVRRLLPVSVLSGLCFLWFCMGGAVLICACILGLLSYISCSRKRCRAVTGISSPELLSFVVPVHCISDLCISESLSSYSYSWERVRADGCIRAYRDCKKQWVSCMLSSLVSPYSSADLWNATNQDSLVPQFRRDKILGS